MSRPRNRNPPKSNALATDAPTRIWGATAGTEDWAQLFAALRTAIADFPPAGINALRALGFDTPFQVLVATLLSTRTRDEVTVPVSQRLFTIAPTPEAIIALPREQLVTLLQGVGFPSVKARDAQELAQALVTHHGGVVPRDAATLQTFRGVGPKVAALTLALGHNQPSVCVDVHVHRIVNRWGMVATSSPVETQHQLEAILPPEYWARVNEYLVPFGKFHCTAARPRCPSCPLTPWCRRIGVKPLS